MARTKKTAETAPAVEPMEPPTAPVEQPKVEQPEAGEAHSHAMQEAAQVIIRMDNNEVIELLVTVQEGDNIMQSLGRETGKVTLNVNGVLHHLNVRNVAHSKAQKVLVPQQ